MHLLTIREAFIYVLKVTKTKMMLSFACDCNLRWGMALDDNSNNQNSLNSFMNPRKSEKKRT